MPMPFEQPARYQPAIAPPEPRPGASLWFLFRRSELLVAEPAAHAPLPFVEDPGLLGFHEPRRQYLGRLDARHCFTAEVAPDAQAPPGWTFRGLRRLFNVLDDGVLAVAGRALQLVDWDRSHRYCGACGGATTMRTFERARECPDCALVVYPRLAPVVMCLVRRGSSLLLARSPRFPEGVYSALAGFVEPGETLEQCVEREVFEEVGVRVRNLRYFASQPWPFPHSLMIAFFADYAGGDIAIDGVEIEAADWFDAGNLPKLPARISIARRLIDAAMGENAAG
jgi:NAD+ diphosphatase